MSKNIEELNFRIIGAAANPFDVDASWYHSSPLCKSVKEIHEKSNCESEVFQAPSKIFNQFLKEKFDMDLLDFMEVYSKLHKAPFTREMLQYIFPLPQNIICFFNEETDPHSLKHKLLHYQSSIIEDHFGHTHLNLMEVGIYRFTLLKAKFSLEKNKQCFLKGYFYKTEKYHFFIQSSIQFHLTVLYEDLTE